MSISNSIIITTYNSPNYLRRVLEGLMGTVSESA